MTTGETSESPAAQARLARLGLGTVQFGLPYGVSNPRGQVAPEEARAIIDLAGELGITVLDTAAAYGNAEEVLGGILTDRSGFRVVSKTLPGRHGLEAVEARVRQSADVLGTALETLLVHHAADLAGAEGAQLWAVLERLRDEGVCRRIGISAYFADDPLALARRFRPSVMQLPVSLLDQRCVADGTLAALQAAGVDIHARSVFLQGLLLMPPRTLPKSLAHAAAALSDVQARIAEAESSPLAAGLAFVLNRPEIAVVLVGVTSVQELQEIAAAVRAPAPEIDYAACALNDPVVLTPSLW